MVDIYKEIIEQFPGFAKMFSENKENYFDGNKPLNYIVMSDFAKYYLKQFKENNMREIEKTNNLLLKLLEEEETNNLVVIGFLESINPIDPSYSKLKQSIPVELKVQLERIERFWNGEKID